MSGRNEEADLQNNDSEGGIDNKRMEIVYQREPHPNMSKHNELETTLADPVKKAQNDEEAEMDRVRTDNREELWKKDGTANEINAMRQAQAPVYNASPIWTYILGGGILALVAPYALSAWRSSAISFFEASSMTPMPSLSDENIFITAGQSIPWNMAATAGIGIANHAIIFASKGSITPRLG